MTITIDTIKFYESDRSLWAGERERPKFTPAERAAIDRYNRAIEGYEDCFPLVKEDIDKHMAEFDLPATLRMVDSHFRMLETWRDAIDTLYVDLCTGDDPDPGPHATSVELITQQGRELTSMVTLTREAVCVAFVGTAGPVTADDGRVIVGCM